jgi:two-component system sensor histidine kinase KdpD
VPSGRSEPRHDEVQSLRLFADQLALALDTVELASQVRDAQFEADASNVRAALFASVTHDLRTPLASILASATTLRSEGALEPEVRGELVDAICEEADRLNRLVGNLLELSRIRAGAMTPSKTPTPVDELVGGVLARLRRSLGGHDVVTSIPTDLPEVPMDVVQMDQVVTNLLENAMRFAPAGTPIRVTAERDDGDIRIAIVDEGPGIPSADRERVFEPFVRGSAGGGAGLGLAICRAIVESHGGTIRVDDRRERGAAVIVELPLDGA